MGLLEEVLFHLNFDCWSWSEAERKEWGVWSRVVVGHKAGRAKCGEAKAQARHRPGTEKYV